MKSQNTLSRFTSKGVFPYQWAFTLLIPLRNIFLSPKNLMTRLQLKSHDHVLEIGPGPGYFSTHIANKLIDGKLVLADIQQEMLNYARKRLEKRNFKNIDFYLCDRDTFRLESNYFDIIFMVTVIGEVENKEAYMQEFYRMLKPGGILSISELAGDPDKMTISALKNLATKHGFKVDHLYGNEKNYTLNLKK